MGVLYTISYLDRCMTKQQFLFTSNLFPINLQKFFFFDVMPKNTAIIAIFE